MILVALILTVVAGILWYFNRCLTYWQRKGVPTPGLLYQWHYYRRELGPYDVELAEKLGPVYGVYEGLKPILIVSDPDLIRDILVKDFTSFPNHKPFRVGVPTLDLNLFSLDGGEDWKRIRALLSPTFTSGKLRAMDPIVNDCIQIFKRNLDIVADKGQVIDVKRYFNSLSFDVLCRCAYGAHIESLNDPNSPIQKNFEQIFSGRWDFIITLMFPKFAAWTGIRDMTTKSMQFFVDMTTTLIEDRKKVAANGKVYNDFLQTMLMANEEAKKEIADNGSASSDQQFLKKTMTDEEMVAQSLIFLIAGFDTSATILACTAYHLAKNPQVQERLAKEVSALDEYSHDTVMNLKYLEAVLKESFRLSPPAVRVERECTIPTLLGSVKLEPHTIVSIPVFAVHRDSAQYENPDEFDPERFMGENGGKYHMYSHLPFGGGPRMCIAQRFALMEVKLSLAQIVKDFRFEAVPETKIGYRPASFDILAVKPIMLNVRRA